MPITGVRSNKVNDSQERCDACDIASIVNLTQYPIENLETQASQALIMQCRIKLQDTGALVLPDFLSPPATMLLAAEARRLDGAVHQYHADHTVYFEPRDNRLPEDHPRRYLVRTDKGSVSYDLIPANALLRRLYEWDPLLTFVAAVLGESRLYRHGDPMAALNINVHEEGQQLGWHFDRTDFAVTLSLQQSEAGGIFEYVPNLRTTEDENYDGVSKVLAGNRDGVRFLPAAPGTLTLFRGHYSLHRVSPGSGPSKRLMAALSYASVPGVTFSAYARKLFYGREAPLDMTQGSGS
jgi:alkylated DNA repair dioxygenase AlkB